MTNAMPTRQILRYCPTPRMCRVIERPWNECSVHNLRPEIPDCTTDSTTSTGSGQASSPQAGHTPSRVLADNGFTYEVVCAHCGAAL